MRTTKSVIAEMKKEFPEAVLQRDMPWLCIDKKPTQHFETLASGSVLIRHVYDDDNMFKGSHVQLWINQKDFKKYPELKNHPVYFMPDSQGAVIHLISSKDSAVIHTLEFISTYYGSKNYEYIAYPCKNEQFAEAMIKIAINSIGITNFRPQKPMVTPYGKRIQSTGKAEAVLHLGSSFGPVQGRMDCMQFMFMCTIQAGYALRKRTKKLSFYPIPSMDIFQFCIDLVGSPDFTEEPVKCYNLEPQVAALKLSQQKAIIESFKKPAAQAAINLYRGTLAQDSSGFKRKMQTIITGLQKSSHLNGKPCILLGFMQDNQRWIAWVDGAKIQIKPKHLKRIFSKQDYVKVCAGCLLACVGVLALCHFLYNFSSFNKESTDQAEEDPVNANFFKFFMKSILGSKSNQELGPKTDELDHQITAEMGL